jgi:hypothetical protein
VPSASKPTYEKKRTEEPRKTPSSSQAGLRKGLRWLALPAV